MHFMKSIKHIEAAIKELDGDIQTILMDFSISLTEKDNQMLPLVREAKVLKQTLEDLKYLEANPPVLNQPCGISKYRED